MGERGAVEQAAKTKETRYSIVSVSRIAQSHLREGTEESPLAAQPHRPNPSLQQPFRLSAVGCRLPLPAARRLVLALALCLCIAACGGPDAVATRPTLALPTRETQQPTSGPAQSLGGASLPGRLLFVQNGAIWLWQGDKGQPLIGGGNAFQPSFSRDGARIVYVERGASYSDVMVADAAGAHLAQLTTNGSRNPPGSAERIYESTWAFYPAFTPDGTAVVYAGQAAPPVGDPAAELNMSLFRTAAGEGGVSEQIVADDGGQLGRSAVAPDGSIFYARASIAQGGALELYRYTPGAGAAPVEGAPAPSYDPALSPDGRWLAFAAQRDGQTDIWLLPTGGGAAQRLSNTGSARAPTFSPDGAQLAFLAIAPGSRSFDLWALDLAPDASGNPRPGQPRQITLGLNLDADSGVAWAP
jgi:TolB protein